MPRGFFLLYLYSISFGASLVNQRPVFDNTISIFQQTVITNAHSGISLEAPVISQLRSWYINIVIIAVKGTVVAYKNRFLIIAFTAAVYFVLYQVNMTLFGSLHYSHRVDLIFLPSGLRLAFVLLFAIDGALGIMIASTLITYLLYFDGSYLSLFITGSLAGLAPFVARHLAIDLLKLDRELSNLNPFGLFKVSVLFAIISPLIHQTWYFWTGRTENFLASAAMMMVGDWLGTVLVLACFGLLVPLVRRAL